MIQLAYTLKGFRLPKNLLRNHILGIHNAIGALCMRKGGRRRTNQVIATSLHPLHLQKWTRGEGRPSFKIKLFSPLKLFPRKRKKWNVVETLCKFLYIYIEKFTQFFFFFSFLNVTQSCPSLTLPVLFPLKCFLLPAATYHFIRMPGDHFHTMPADVIFLDAHTVHHLDTR